MSRRRRPRRGSKAPWFLHARPALVCVVPRSSAGDAEAIRVSWAAGLRDIVEGLTQRIEVARERAVRAQQLLGSGQADNAAMRRLFEDASSGALAEAVRLAALRAQWEGELADVLAGM